MKDYEGQIIKSVVEDSIADQLGICPGDRLLTIDDCEIHDIIDYRFRVNSESMVMLIEKPDGEQWEFEIENDYEDPGLEFEDGLMSPYKACANKCIFCFIDQMPKGMRDTLYFKDDDSRLSFLQGNYVTLTNMKEAEIQRIIDYNMSPINISVHTTNPELRCRMLGNRFAGEVLKYIDMLYEAGIAMNAQIVLCPGYNDGEELVRTLDDLMKYAPVMESVSIVPVGLTKYREGLTVIDEVSPELSASVIDLVERYQNVAMENWGIHYIHASDEFYLKAGIAIPDEFNYDGYPQIENGVGMVRSFIDETNSRLSELTVDESEDELSVATGELFAPVLEMLLNSVKLVFPNKHIHLYPIHNDFFGHSITVSGLLTGRDLIDQLRGKCLGRVLYIPKNMLRSGEEVFLDDITVNELSKELNVEVRYE